MTDTKEPGLRERKRVATRHAIERAAIELSLDKGYDAVTVDEIAEAADVSPRTFFNYFPSKEAAVVGHVPEGGPSQEQIDVFLAGGPEQPILDGIQLMLMSFVEEKSEEDARNVGELQEMRMQLMLKHPALFRLRMESMDAVVARMTDLVARRLVADFPALADDPVELRERARLVVYVSFAGMRNAWASWSDRGGNGPLAACVKRSFEQLHALAQVNVNL